MTQPYLAFLFPVSAYVFPPSVYDSANSLWEFLWNSLFFLPSVSLPKPPIYLEFMRSNIRFVVILTTSFKLPRFIFA